MLVPLTITQSARPPRVCGRPNQRQAATRPPSAASFATARGSWSRPGVTSYVGRAADGTVPVPALLLIGESHRGPLCGRVVLGRTDGRGVGAARVAELPAPERAGLDRRVDVCRDGN